MNATETGTDRRPTRPRPAIARGPRRPRALASGALSILRGLPLLSPAWLRRWALLSVVSNVLIIVTGGAVRLTASGLGCPVWPRCTDDSYVPTPEMGVHGAIEFGNRMLTFVLVVVAVGTLVAALVQVPRRKSVTRLALALAFGIPLQAIVGGITVNTGLNPWVVMFHFLVSALMVGLATVLLQRTGEGDAPPRPLVPPPLRWLAAATLCVVGATVYLGTVTTGSGPHAGDADAVRTGLDPVLVSQLHADLAFLLVGMTVAQAIALAATSAPARTRRAAWVLLGVELGQGVIGYTQYFLGLPVLLVGFHMLGASLLVIAATRLLLATRDRGAPPQATAARAATPIPAEVPAPAPAS